MSSKYRRADNGQYTTKKYSESHPKTTVKETDKKIANKNVKKKK